MRPLLSILGLAGGLALGGAALLLDDEATDAAEAPVVAQEDDDGVAAAPPDRPPRGGGPPGRPPRPPADTGPRGDEPVYVLLFTHHYGGKGGYYATAAQVRDVADGVEDAGLAHHVTLFFDGIGIERLNADDPKLLPSLKARGFPVGFHGEDVHGPWPVIDGEDEGGQGLVTSGMDFAAAVDAIRERYTHALAGAEFDDRGYIRRAVPGRVDRARPGGIASVKATFGEVPIASGSVFTQPAAWFALRAAAPELRVWQGAGPFAIHFLRRAKDSAVIEPMLDYLGRDTTAFWFMNTLAMRQGPTNDLPSWGEDGRRTRAALDALPRREPTVVTLNVDVDADALPALLGGLKTWVDAHPGSAFVSAAELYDRVEPPTITLDPAAVAAAVGAQWSGGPPDVLALKGQRISLVEGFEALARALAAGSAAKVTTTGLVGPIGAPVSGAGAVTVADVLAAAKAAVAEAEGSPWRALPASVAVGGTRVGTHQLLRLMADAFEARDAPKKALTVPTGEPYPPTVRTLLRAFPHPSAPDVDAWIGGQLWTARPVTWR